MEEEKKEDMEGIREAEETISKIAESQDFKGSNPLPSVDKKIVKSKEKVEALQYKLNLYRANGQLRTDISKAVIYEASKNWGDLIRVIPNNRWSTNEEIVQLVWEWEKRQYRKSFSRSRKQIDDGLKALTVSGILLTK